MQIPQSWLTEEGQAKENVAIATVLALVTKGTRPALYLPIDGSLTTPPREYRSLSGLDLCLGIFGLCQSFQKQGLRPGQRALLMVPPGEEFFTLTFACFLYGLVPIFIDPGMDVRSLKSCVSRSDPEIFFGIWKAHLARLLLGLKAKSLKRTIVVGPGWLPGTQSWASFRFATSSPPENPDNLDAKLSEMAQTISVHGIHQSPAAVLFTSGSTGPAKGALYTHKMFVAQIESIRSLFNIQDTDVDLATFPLFALFAPALGMTAVVPKMDFRKPAKVNPENIFSAIETFGVSNFFGSPALLSRLASQRTAQSTKQLQSLKRVISAGAPVSYKVIEIFKSMLPESTELLTPYGATEAMPISCIGAEEILASTARIREGKGVCVGKICSPMKVRILPVIDKDQRAVSDPSRDCKVGEIGEIAVCGPVVSPSYDQLNEATLQAKFRDETTGVLFHRMGDMGYLDQEGRLWFCGRLSHRVKSKRGRYLQSVSTEAFFNEHPLVARSALCSYQNDTQSAVVLFVEPRATYRASERTQLLAQLRTIAIKHGISEDIDYIDIHPSFPVDTRHNAKIFREKLGLLAAARFGKAQELRS
jgi:acyl-CoA synthetase (AMP-forming)/AMP-acid ligase II